MAQLASRGWLDRTLFFMPPNVPFHRAFSAVVRAGSRWKAPPGEPVDLRDGWEHVRARAHEVGVELPAYRDQGGLFRIAGGRVEWVTAFGHEHLFGKPPARALKALEPILDRLIAEWRAHAPPGTSKPDGQSARLSSRPSPPGTPG